MRGALVLLSVMGLALVPAAWVYGQCEGYPSTKTWEAGGPNKIFEADGLNFPGWGRERGNSEDISHFHPENIMGKTAQRDLLDFLDNEDGKLKYRSDDIDDPQGDFPEWDVQGDGTLSITWDVIILDSQGNQTTMPAIKLRNNTHRLRLDFNRRLVNDNCTLSGWQESDGTRIVSGGRVIGDARYLLMTMNEWHTVRADLHVDGSFDVWIDGGGSDWKHISGIAGEGGDNYVQFGSTDSKDGRREWATSCVAWGEGDDEIPAAPAPPEEICGNGLDDDFDGDFDCDDVDCDCSLAIPSECLLITEVVERFNTEFETVETGQLPPGWGNLGYGPPGNTDNDPQGTNPNTGERLPSVWSLDPVNPNPGLDECDPGIEAFCDAQLEACLDLCGGDPVCEDACQDADTFCAPGQPIRVNLPFDLIPEQCDNDGPPTEACYDGRLEIGLVDALGDPFVPIDEVVKLPIDWSQTVTVKVMAAGSDLSGPSLDGIGIWETFIAAPGYTVDASQNPADDVEEWGTGSGGTANAVDGDDYVELSLILAPGQANQPNATLSFGVDFDYWDEIGGAPITLPADKTSQAFFENVAVEYQWDTTVPILQRAPCVIQATIPPAPDGIGAVAKFTVRNDGPDSPLLNYTITEQPDDPGDPDWLSIQDPNGDLNAGELDFKTVVFDPTGLTALLPEDPPYTATITVNAPGAHRPVKTIAVELRVELAAVIPPDYDRDGDVDQADFAVQQNCTKGQFATPEPGVCAQFADLNGDNRVDSQDTLIFEGCATGPGIPFDPACTP